MQVTKPNSGPRPSIAGGAASSLWAGNLSDWLDENPRTKGDGWYGSPGYLGESQKMGRDSIVRLARDAVVRPVVAAHWTMKPASDSDQDKEVADFIGYCLLELTPWRKWLGTALRGMVAAGFSLTEVTDDARPISALRFPRHPNPRAAIVPTGFWGRPAWSVESWVQNPKQPEQLSGVKQYLMGSDVEQPGTVKIPADRLIRMTWEQEGAQFTGDAIYRSAYGAWFAKLLLWRISLMGHERYHVPPPVVETDAANAAALGDDAKLDRDLAAYRSNERQFLKLPPGMKLALGPGGTATNIEASLARCDIYILANVAAAWLLHGTRNTNGSYALAGTQAGFYDRTLEEHGNFVADAINFGQDGWSIIERLVRLNYGPNVGLPRLIAHHMPTINWRELAPVVSNLVGQGVMRADDELEAFLRQVLHLPPADVPSLRETPKNVADDQPVDDGPADDEANDEDS